MTTDAWDRRTVLVLGARGMLGSEFVRQIRGRTTGQSDVLVDWDIDELDIRDAGRVRHALEALSPGVVINAAACTDVDGCETRQTEAVAVNAGGPANLAHACAAVNALLVHFSTDFVFDGKATEPYAVDATAHPLSVYGKTKWAGEEAIRSESARHLIVRTSWLFGVGGRSFVDAILERAESGEPLRVVTDQIGSPTHAVDLASAVIRLLEASADGTVHFANAGQCSWHEFACEILRQSGLDRPVGSMTSSELDRPAVRPAYSVLDTSSYAAITGDRPRPWPDALRSYLELRQACR